MASALDPKQNSQSKGTKDVSDSRIHSLSIMERSQHIQRAESEEAGHDEESTEYVESEDDVDVDESVVEDMRKLEESFKGISQQYKLMNRIGEGSHFAFRISHSNQGLDQASH